MPKYKFNRQDAVKGGKMAMSIFWKKYNENEKFRIKWKKSHDYKQMARAAYKSRLQKIGKDGMLKQMKQVRRRRSITREIMVPSNNEKVAEIICILLGDGNLQRKQLRIFGDMNKDKRYLLNHVSSLFKELFGVKPIARTRTNLNVLYIEVNRKLLCLYFHDMHGLPYGNKIKKRACVPKWIINNIHFIPHGLRGLFDTDGCFWHKQRFDVKNKLGRRAMRIEWQFGQESLLPRDIKNMLAKINIKAIKRGNRVFFGTKEDVLRFIKIVKPSNEKHKKKIRTAMNGLQI